MASANTANTSKISLVVSQQVPEFVRTDHPKFVTFLEKYYEFMEQHIGTSGLPGALSASKSLPDSRDPDFSDFNLFLDSIRKEFSPTLPASLANDNVNQRTLYKHLTDLYRAKGSEDSFKLIFRLLYGEEIELYYPKDDMLIASGGEWASYKKMFVVQTSNSAMLENRIITGATSGATAIVEKAETIFAESYAANSTLYDDKYLTSKEVLKTALYLNTDSITGAFSIHEKIYTGTGDGKTNVVTIILPIVSKVVFFDDFSAHTNTSYMIAFDDNRGNLSNLSFNVPWDNFGTTANIQTVPSDLIGNSGPWYNATGNGQIQIVAETNVSGNKVLQIGNNYTFDGSWSTSENWDDSWLVHNQNISFDPNKLYRMSVRARDFADSANTDRSRSYYGLQGIQSGGINLAGYAAKHSSDDNKVVAYKSGSTTIDTYANASHWVVANGTPLSSEWFVYEGHVQGKSSQGAVASSNGSGGFGVRTDYGRAPEAEYYSVDSPATLNYYADYVRPVLAINQQGGGDITQIDYVKIEEISAIADVSGEYLDEASLISSKGGYLQDNWYRQTYAYEIRSQKELAKYKGTIQESVHPAGTRMFGNKIQHSKTTLSVNADSNANSQDTFSPDQLDSLAAWWKADALVANNFQIDPNIVGGNVVAGFDTTNWMPPGYSNHEGDSFDRMAVSSGNYDIDVEISYDDHAFGNKSLKIYKPYTPANYGEITWKGEVDSVGAAANQSNFMLNIPYGKKWVFSAYIKTDNNTIESSGQSNFGALYIQTGNSYGANVSFTNGKGIEIAMPSSINQWQRIQGTELLDMSTGTTNLDTKANLRFRIYGAIGTQGSADAATKALANVTSYMDGMMLEQYDPNIHGGSHPYTLSDYTLPSYNGCNVTSWNDCSINQHHLYANTHGSDLSNPNANYYGGSDDPLYNLRPPIYIANAVNGYPAVDFQGPNINAAAWTLATDSENEGTTRRHPANTYRWSPHPHDSVSGIFLANTHLGDSSQLVRPLANSWSFFVVGKLNLSANDTNYATTADWEHGIIRSGGDRDVSRDANSGGLDLGITRATLLRNGSLNTMWRDYQGKHHVVYATPNVSVSGTAVAEYTSNNDEWFIYGVSEYAHNGAATEIDPVNMHIMGFRSSNDNMTFSGNPATSSEWYNWDRDGFSEEDSENAVTMVGSIRPFNGSTHAFTGEVISPYDGQIAEMLVFNEKLANNQIAKVEGYLAHKYGLQDKLIHKDGNTTTDDHPYKTTKPPAVVD